MAQKRKATLTNSPTSNQNLIIIAVIIGVSVVLAVLIGVSSMNNANNSNTSGGSNDAITQYENYLASNPDNIDARISLGNAYFERATDMRQQNDETGSSIQFLSAIQNYEKVIEKQPDNYTVLGDLATAYFYTNRVEDAITTVQTALEISPNFPQARFNYAVYLGYGKADYQQAIQELKKIDKSAEQYADAQQMIKDMNDLATGN